MKVTILLPSRQKRHLIQYIKDKKSVDDDLIIFNCNSNQLTTIVNKMIKSIDSGYIILVDPQCKDIDFDIIKKGLPNIFYDDINNIIGFPKEKFVNVEKKYNNYKSYQRYIATSIDPNICLERQEKLFKYNKISIIIPFMFNGDRWNLFEHCISNLHNLIKHDLTFELVIHETGPTKMLEDSWIKKFNIQYEYTIWNDIFHRAWSLNYAAKHIATGDLFVFMDADLVVDKMWIESIKKCDNVAIGWSEMVNLNENGTKKCLNDSLISILPRDIERTRKPNVYSAAGGINIYPKEVFYEMKGWCEDYYGTYGGEDNSTFLKLQKFGYNNRIIKAKVFHLHHSHTTFKHPVRFKIFNEHKKYSKDQWIQYVNNIKNWGESNIETVLNEKKIKILWCKIDTSKRVAGHYDDLLSILTSECHVDTLTQSLQDLHPAVFQQKCLSSAIKRDEIVKNHLQFNPYYDFIICADIFAFNNEDWSKITIPKAAMFEDQHGDNNLQQIKLLIKDKWIVLHRYKFKKFHTDLNKYLKCIWLPHSVNVQKFRDFKYKKEYDILQTGALYKVYETRNFMLETFKDDPRYKLIPRPKEGDTDQWPTGREYSKLLNKAYLNVCCGSIYQYPIMKYFEIPASGGVIFGDWFEELGELGFEPYKNMLTIDKSNVKSQVDLLLSNKKNLLRIAENGYNLIHERHTNEIRANELIEIIKEEIKCQHPYQNL